MQFGTNHSSDISHVRTKPPIGMGADTPGTPGSQGLPGQQILKKQKLFKADTNSDVVPTSLIPTSQACQIQSKLLKQNSMRDRNRRARPNSKVSCVFVCSSSCSYNN